jgi:predicted nucleic acid-binding protein
MPGSFLDTNVLLYVASEESKKADRAEEILAAGGTISVQVLNEVVNVARRKMRMSWEDISSFLAAVRNLATVASLTVETHEVGIALAERYGFATYDTMIVASALLSDCDILWSEDMQHGMAVDGRLRIANPFRGF